MGIYHNGKNIAFDYKGYLDKRLSDFNKDMTEKLADMQKQIDDLNRTVEGGFDQFQIGGTTAPSNTAAIWFDTRIQTNNLPLIKFYNGSSKKWVPFGAGLI